MPEEPRSVAKKLKRTPETGRGRDAQALVAALRAAESSAADVFETFWQLDGLPEEDVREALTSWVGALPDLDRLEPAMRIKHGLPLRPLRLRELSVSKDADVLDLGPIAEEQLRIAGKTWDGEDLPAEDRLDGELPDSFAGTLERRVLADTEAPGEPPLFDVLSFLDGSGVVFAAGTTKVVALVAYHRVEMRDRRTRTAIEEAMSAREANAAAKPAIEKVAKRATKATKTPAKTAKTAPKKAVARKAVQKSAAKAKTPASTKARGKSGT